MSQGRKAVIIDWDETGALTLDLMEVLNRYSRTKKLSISDAALSLSLALYTVINKGEPDKDKAREDMVEFIDIVLKNITISFEEVQ